MATNRLDNPGQVDVVIAAWSAQTTIARAIESALNQAEVARVIVVDDASPDDTVAAAMTCDKGDGRLLVLRQSINAGPSAARNRAIASGTAPWIAILDADDFMNQGRIGKLLALAADCDLIADDVLVVDEGAEDMPPRAMLGGKAPETLIDLRTFVEGNVAHRSNERAELGFIKPLIRRNFLDLHNLQYDEALRLGEDYDLYSRALAQGARLRVMPPQGYVYVQRPSSLSGSHSEQDLLRLREADRRLLARPDLDALSRRALRSHYRSVDCRLQWRRVIRAVKERAAGEVVAAFVRSPQVSFYLAGKLGEQAVLRTARRFGAAT